MSSSGKEAVLKLYRGILRAHKMMPSEMRSLGDTYVRQEFKLHKSVTNEAQLQGFFNAWEGYLEQMLATARRKESVVTGNLDEQAMDNSGYGKDLPSDVSFSDEQQTQLEKLKDEASKGP